MDKSFKESLEQVFWFAQFLADSEKHVETDGSITLRVYPNMDVRDREFKLKLWGAMNFTGFYKETFPEIYKKMELEEKKLAVAKMKREIEELEFQVGLAKAEAEDA